MGQWCRPVEAVNADLFGAAYRGKRVLITGHTGFKGSWLTMWLLHLGAEVAGYSDTVPTNPAHFDAADIGHRIHDYRGDIRDRERLNEAFDDFRPEIVFHLAAQALVRRSYADPVRTFEVNALGPLNVLDSARHRPFVRTVVVITSDKCYRNVEWVWGYRETDALGGDDPYSASKAAAELVCHSYMRSYFTDDGLASVATARAGNVIGGGDWAVDRLVPDCMRAWSTGATVTVRSPSSTRPWQHVLEPLGGYLWLGAALQARRSAVVGQSYNFGPDANVDAPVLELIRGLAASWPGAAWRVDELSARGQPEARLLKLSCDKALSDLAWRPTLAFAETLRLTSEWYREFYGGGDMYAVTMDQIAEYGRLAQQRGLPWARNDTDA